MQRPTHRDLRRAGIRCSVATTSRRAWVEPLVDRLFGRGAFDVVVTGDDVAKLKPAPRRHLRAIELLGLAPEVGLAVEDSPPPGPPIIDPPPPTDSAHVAQEVVDEHVITHRRSRRTPA